MGICKCSCHLKSRRCRMHAFDRRCNCCNHPDIPYLNEDGTIDETDLDDMVNLSIDDWYNDRRKRMIEYYPTSSKFKKKGKQ